uniref:hypothetical protein n=1 Tax=uncultured Oscillibacter sp. TaxID=876091 RepID=UPI0025EE1180
ARMERLQNCLINSYRIRRTMAFPFAISSNNVKTSVAVFQMGKARLRVKHAVFDDEIHIEAAECGLLRRLRRSA